jgi:hypothetical protein
MVIAVAGLAAVPAEAVLAMGLLAREGERAPAAAVVVAAAAEKARAAAAAAAAAVVAAKAAGAAAAVASCPRCSRGAAGYPPGK